WRAGGETAAPLFEAVAANNIDGPILVVGLVVAAPGAFMRTDAASFANNVITAWTFRPAIEVARSLSGTNGGEMVLTGGQAMKDDQPTDIVEYFKAVIPL